MVGKTRAILREYGFRPQKRRGQNFLFKEQVLKKIAAAASIRADETVVEIGPGPGNLTRRLVKQAKKVIAIELEPELAAILKAEVRAVNLEVIEANVLDLDFCELFAREGKLKVVANLPYNISTPLLFKMLDEPALFSELLLLLQEEVAERIAAPAGKKPYGILAVQAQMAADCEIALRVGPEAFAPRPKVNSALVRMRMRDEPRAKVNDMQMFKRVVRAAFARRRKTLRNSFATGSGFSRDEVQAALEAAGIDPGRRAETVTIEEFAALTRAFSKKERSCA